jgi:hypothetical protein
MMNIRENHKSIMPMQITTLGKIIISTILLLNLTACATYKSSFNCGDSKGVYCAPMDRVDQMIDSGEIERFNEQRQQDKPYKALKNYATPNITAVQNQKSSEAM